MKHTEFYASGLPKPETFEQISDTIWSYAETRYHESKSAKLLCEALEGNGFCVTRPYAGIDTCFLAEYGSGRPVIGILGEYDALPGLSQVADCPEKKPVEAGGNGHGCGHHLLGTASLEAVCMLKQLMEQNAIQGTIRYYGCPAEEGGAGKGFMVRAGVFSDVDACITWHPMDVNGVMNHTLANMRMLFDFYGKSAHAAAAPFEGRSALDAVELTDIGCNYLREHVIPEARIHYAITDAGGPAANVVQAHAQEVYCIRAPRQDQVEEIFGRVCNCARGAALMTDTRAEIQVVSAYA
ncbi:MAG: amidohydrolase, partial [Oscillospiraceae bacterium]|nr:amidohydrolase [Oscillospiraceae bacterium]